MFFANWRLRSRRFLPLLIVFLFLLSWVARVQVGYWQNSQTLLKHALDVTSENYIAYNNLGNVYMDQGLIDMAIFHYTESLAIHPGYEKAHYNLGNALLNKGDFEKAVFHYSEALRNDPNFASAHQNLGIVMEKNGETIRGAHTLYPCAAN